MKNVMKKVKPLLILMLYKFLPYLLIKRLQTWKFFLLRPRLIFNLNKKFENCDKPILVLSAPRSGSSWVGDILGTGENVRYLREPVTSAYMQGEKKRVSLFELEKCEDLPFYLHQIKHALEGKLSFVNGVVKNPKQWKDGEIPKPLVIKEVNPFLISHCKEYCNCKVIYLVRHPFLLAKSFKALGWLENIDLDKRLTTSHVKLLSEHFDLSSQSKEFELGVLLGVAEYTMLSELSEMADFLVVKYEDLCKEPIKQFSSLFQFSKLTFDIQIQNKIQNSTFAKKEVAAGDFSLRRNSIKAAKITEQMIQSQEYIDTMSGYNSAISALSGDSYTSLY